MSMNSGIHGDLGHGYIDLIPSPIVTIIKTEVVQPGFESFISEIVSQYSIYGA